MKVGIIIPARLKSERLPNKVLKRFSGMTMIEHVWRRAQLAEPLIETVIATDSEEILATCETFGAKCLITSAEHFNGLSRVGEVAAQLKWDFYIILQADEILVDPKDLNKLIKIIQNEPKYKFYNLTTQLDNVIELYDENIVKCITRKNQTIISIFRKTGLISPELTQLKLVKKICGVFSISHNELLEVINSPSQDIEINESIEQMKVIELGIDVYSVGVEKNYPSVNTVQEALEVEEILKSDPNQANILNLIKVTSEAHP